MKKINTNETFERANFKRFKNILKNKKLHIASIILAFMFLGVVYSYFLITPYNINHAKDIITFTFLGGIVSIGFVLISYLFDTKIKIEEDVEEFIGTNVLASIPLYNEKTTKAEGKKHKFKELITHEEIKSPVSESFRKLKTNLIFSQKRRIIKNILVTSYNEKEGKSWVAANMAVTFAQSGKKVVIVDADMHNGRQHNIFKMQNDVGLSNCLSGSNEYDSLIAEKMDEYLQTTEIPNVHILTSGAIASSPLDLLTSGRMNSLIGILDFMYDIVILDGTSSSLVSDGVALSAMADTTIIVAESKKTKISDIKKMKKMIETAGGTIGGIIINKMPAQLKDNKCYTSVEAEKQEKIELYQKIETVPEIIARAKYRNNEPNSTIPDSSQLFSPKYEDQADYAYTKNIENKIVTVEREISLVKDLLTQFLLDSKNTATLSETKYIEMREKLDSIKIVYSGAIQDQILGLKEDVKTQNISNLERIIEKIKELEQEYNLLSNRIEELDYAKAIEELNNNLESFKQISKEDTLNLQNELNMKMQEIKEAYEIKIEEKFSSIEDVLIRSNNTEELKEVYNQKINEIREIYENKIVTKFMDFEAILNENKSQIYEIKYIYNKKIEELKQNYDDKLGEKITYLEEVIYQNNHYQDLKETYIEQIKGLEEKYNAKIEQKFKEIQDFISRNTDIEELKQSYSEQLDQLRKDYDSKLDEKISYIEGVIESNNHYEDLKEFYITQIEDLKKNYDDRIEKRFEEMEKQLSKKEDTEEIKSIYMEQIKSLKEEFNNIQALFIENNNLDDIKEELIKIKNMFNNLNYKKNNKKMKKIIDIESSEASVLYNEILPEENILRARNTPSKKSNASRVENPLKAMFKPKGQIDNINKIDLQEEQVTFRSQILTPPSDEEVM